MKIYRKTPIMASYKEGLVSIWWYKDGEFWDFSKTTDDAVECQGYLQYSNTKNHLNLWSQAVTTFVDDPSEREKIRNAGYKSLERGRVIFNIRTQCYEIICSTELANDPEFRKTCVDYFNLRGNRYDFVPLHHYGVQKLTGNPALDDMYYESQF